MSVSIFLSETVAVKSSLKFNGRCRRWAAGSCRQVESHYNRPLISTNREHRRRAPCNTHASMHAHTHTHKTCSDRQRPSSPDWAHYIPPTPSHHHHQGPDHTVGRRPAAGGRVLAFSRVRNNNTSGLISSSTSQLPGPDISSRCYCFAWALLSCPFLSTTALRKGLRSRGVGACLDSRGPHPHSGSQWQTSNMISQGRQRGVWQENNLTVPGARSILSSVCNTRYIRAEKRWCLPVDGSDRPGGSRDMKKKREPLVC